MVTPTQPGFPTMLQPPCILPAPGQVAGMPVQATAPACSEGVPDMSMAQWMYHAQGAQHPMQMMVPVQMMMGTPMVLAPHGDNQVINQPPLPPGAPCMWVPSLGTSAKPDKSGANHAKNRPGMRPKVAKYAGTAVLAKPAEIYRAEPRDYVAEMVKNARPRPVVARAVAPGQVAPGPVGAIMKKPVQAGSAAAPQARPAKGINMKWRTRYVL